jgi:hypothetical protein
VGDVEGGESERCVHRGDEREKRNVVKRDVESGAMWSIREVKRVYDVVVGEECHQSRECMGDGKVADAISSTVKDSEVDKLATVFGEFGYLIPDENKLLERSQPANVLWEFREQIERYIEVAKGGHVANDGRNMAEFIVGYVQRLEHAKPGKIPGKFFHAIILQLEDGQLR